LTYEEYIERTARPLAGADPVFVQVVKEERERMFPMKLVVAANQLRSRGYDCWAESLESSLAAYSIQRLEFARKANLRGSYPVCFLSRWTPPPPASNLPFIGLITPTLPERTPWPRTISTDVNSTN
jgi:hypothetical protein